MEEQELMKYGIAFMFYNLKEKFGIKKNNTYNMSTGPIADPKIKTVSRIGSILGR